MRPDVDGSSSNDIPAVANLRSMAGEEDMAFVIRTQGLRGGWNVDTDVLIRVGFL